MEHSGSPQSPAAPRIPASPQSPAAPPRPVAEAGAGRALAPRLATPADAGEIARLRSELILSQRLDEHWLALCREQLAARLVPGGDARAYVVDAPTGGLAACALGLVQAVLPAPAYPKGLAVRIHSVATEPAHRRRGFARAALSALLTHLEEEGVTLYELYAHGEGSAPLYASLGFAGDPALMRMTRMTARTGTQAS
ncbi:GNAT family N-acetyltransferase [Streptomyces sp. NPDC013953]|uniref:GNAT family N-acetyltransferase n=1 Tax=Streptomyces sp. NPDC013953 TaxID=3364868 RepID=UPI003700BA0A